MKHDNKTLLLLFLYIVVAFAFCGCHQEPQAICTYTHEPQLQNHVWNIQVDGENLKDNPSFAFPYTTFNTVDLETDLNAWLNGDGEAMVTISSPNREYLVQIDSTFKVFELIIFSGDADGNNQIEISFHQSC